VKLTTVELLRCPECHAETMQVDVLRGDDSQIEEGRLECGRCATWFRIENGIADLLPLRLRRWALYEAFSARHNVALTVGQRGGAPISQLEQVRFFAEYHEAYEADVVESPYYRVLDEVKFVDWTRRRVRAADHVLEIGCGSGRQSLPLVRRRAVTLGIDLSEEMLLTARAKLAVEGGADRAEFVVGSAEDPPVRLDAFDACVIYGALHHFEDPLCVLREGAARVRRGGRMYVLEPHASPVRPIFDWLMRFRPLWQEEAHDDGLFTEHQLRAWLSQANVETTIALSTYLPPHLWYVLGKRSGEVVLRLSDAILNRLPGIRRLGGVIIADGVKVA
jgi:SAM-dependent methyltransferase